MRAFSRSLPMALLRGREAVMVRFRPMLRQHGLTEQKWRVLRALADSPQRLRPIELSHMTCIRMPSLSRLLKALDSMGLVENAPHARDLRSVDLALTEAGRKLVREVAPDLEPIYGEITELVGQSKVEAVYELCQLLEGRLSTSSSNALQNVFVD